MTPINEFKYIIKALRRLYLANTRRDDIFKEPSLKKI